MPFTFIVSLALAGSACFSQTRTIHQDVGTLLNAMSHIEYYDHLATLSGHGRFENQIIRDRFSQMGIALARKYIKKVLRQAGYDKVRREPFSTRKNRLGRHARGVNYFVDIPGRSRPDEIILIAAHYDSRGPKIRGANDNATGTAAVLTLAAELARQGIAADRTIRFMLFDAEEMGFYGSLHHFSEATLRGEDIALFINLDMIGYPLTSHDTFVFDARQYKPALHDLLLNASLLMPETGRMRPIPAKRIYRSDHTIALAVGFPTVGIAEHVRNSMGRTVRISPNYHTTKDVIGALDMDYAFGVTRYVGALALLAANSADHWYGKSDLDRREKHCARYLAAALK